MNIYVLIQRIKALELKGDTNCAEYKHLCELYDKERNKEISKQVKNTRKNNKKRRNGIPYK